MFSMVLKTDDEDEPYYRFASNTGHSPSDEDFKATKEWCEERFGPTSTLFRQGAWDHTMTGFYFYFFDKNAAFEFRMRWC